MLIKKLILVIMMVNLSLNIVACKSSTESGENKAQAHQGDLNAIVAQLKAQGAKFGHTYGDIRDFNSRRETFEYQSGANLARDQRVYNLINDYVNVANRFINKYDNPDWFVANMGDIKLKKDLCQQVLPKLRNNIAIYKKLIAENEKKSKFSKNFINEVTAAILDASEILKESGYTFEDEDMCEDGKAILIYTNEEIENVEYQELIEDEQYEKAFDLIESKIAPLIVFINSLEEVYEDALKKVKNDALVLDSLDVSTLAFQLSKYEVTLHTAKIYSDTLQKISKKIEKEKEKDKDKGDTLL